MGQGVHRRRSRRRGERPADPARQPAPAATEPIVSPSRSRAGTERKGRSDRLERAWRELTGSGASQVGVDGALRARDVNRPTEDDLAEAEAQVQIVRRNWSPPDARH